MRHTRAFALVSVITLVTGACASASNTAGDRPAATAAPTVSTVSVLPTTDAPTTHAPTTDAPTTEPLTSVIERADGPAADVSAELTAGNGIFIGTAIPAALAGTGYVEHEFVAAGMATAYHSEQALASDGHWTFTPDTTAEYRTRIVVRRPASAANFSGTVVIEWLNVSGGLDSNPDYASLREDLIRNGDVWVGVSAQLQGVAGGPVLVPIPGVDAIAGKGLRGIDPARYGSLVHPGDGFSFDIFTQVARAIRAGGPAMGDLRPDVVIAAGESQSAIALTTYVDGVQPLTHAFDGFFIHSRAAVALPLVEPGQFADLARGLATGATLLRDDTDVPIIELQAESDVTGVLNSVAARQPDSDRFRLWEVAGTSHADMHLLGAVSATIDCGGPINNGPMHVVAKAAYRGLVNWIRTGTAPPTAPPLVLSEGARPAVQRNSDGIALGGIRTPPVDVPIDVLSGAPGSTPSLICLLLGSTTPLAADRLAELYPTQADYTAAYALSADDAIAAGYVLDDDRDALLAYADPLRITG